MGRAGSTCREIRRSITSTFPGRYEPCWRIWLLQAVCSSRERSFHVLTRADGKLWQWDTVPGAFSPSAHFPGNGLLRLPDGDFLTTWVYTDDLFTGQVYRIPLDAPDRWTVAATVPGLLAGLDDLAASSAGDLYVAAHLAGAIHRVDPETGVACTLGAALPAGRPGPSSVRIAADGDRSALYVTSFDAHFAGCVRRPMWTWLRFRTPERCAVTG